MEQTLNKADKGIVEMVLSYSPHEGQLVLWNLHTRADIRSYRLSGVVNCSFGVALIGNGHFMVADSKANVCYIFHLGASSPVLKASLGAKCSAIGVSACSRFVFAGGLSSGSVFVYELESGALLRTVNAHFRGVSGIATSACSRFVATACLDGSVHVYTTAALVALTLSSNEAAPYFRCNDHVMNVTDLAFDPRTQLLATGGEDRAVYIYATREGTRIATIPVPAAVSKLAFDPAGRYLYIATAAGSIYVYPIANASTNNSNQSIFSMVLASHTSSVTGIECSLDGSTLISAGRDGDIVIWDLEHGLKLSSVSKHQKQPGATVEILKRINFHENSGYPDPHRRFAPFSRTHATQKDMAHKIETGPSNSPAISFISDI